MTSHGTARLLKPIGTFGPACHRAGEIEINGKAYLCRCLDHGYSLYSFDTKKKQTTHYDLPADLSSCECLDHLSRSSRREDGQCKHQKGLAALIGKGKLPKFETSPTPHVADMAECDEENAWADALAESCYIECF